MIWSSTASGHVTYASPEWTDFTGQPMAEALGNGWLSCLHPDDVEPTKQSFKEALKLNAPFIFRYRLSHVGHGYVKVVVTATPSFSSLDESFIGYIGTITEISAINFQIPDINVIGQTLAIPSGALTTPTKKIDIIADYLLLARATAVSSGAHRMIPSLDFAISEVMREIGRALHATVQ